MSLVGWLVGWDGGVGGSGININLNMFENFWGCFSLSDTIQANVGPEN